MPPQPARCRCPWLCGWGGRCRSSSTDSSATIVHLAPSPVVARVRTTWIAGDAQASLAEEVRVAAEVVARGGPVVPPTSDPPPGPHVVDGFALSFWEYAQRVSRRVEPQEAGR